jgi:anti-sigma regulatory factor (Ser/Thr protein kinase)
MAAPPCTPLAPAGGGGQRDPGLFPRAAARSLAPGQDLASVSTARGFARATLHRWGITGPRADDIIVVVSEMTANAVRHTRPGPGRWPVTAGLLQPARGQGVLCAVTDPGPGQPRPRPASHLAESGRGLHVIAALSQQWGHTLSGPAGKIVWALLGPAAPDLPRRKRQPLLVPAAQPATDPVLLARILSGLRSR